MVHLGLTLSPLMHTRFFPLNREADIYARKIRLLEEFGVYNEDMPVKEFMYFSDKVIGIREEKRKAIEAGKVYLGS